MLASLGKAFGLTGGVIASDSEFIKQITENEVFVSSAGMNPAFAQTIPRCRTNLYSPTSKTKR